MVITSSFICSGQYSTTGSAVISTPAAWVDALRGMPSSLRAMSISFLTLSSFSYAARNSELTSIARSIVIFSSNGIIFEIVSTSR